MSDMLATPEDLAALLQEDLDRATTELLIECATAVVQATCGQRILRVIDDEVTLFLDDYDDALWLSLPERPVISVSAVSIGPDPIADWSPQFNRYRLYRPTGWRTSALSYPSAPSTVTVTYTHGYADGDQKLQLARSAVLAFAAQGYTNPTGAMREQIGDYAIQFSDMTARMEATPSLIAALQKQYGRSGTSARLIRS